VLSFRIKQTKLVAFRIEHNNVVILNIPNRRSDSFQSFRFGSPFRERHIEMDAVSEISHIISFLEPHSWPISVDGDTWISFRGKTDRCQSSNLPIIVRSNSISGQRAGPEKRQLVWGFCINGDL